jgi:cell division septal protein FtsQ
MAKKKQYHRTAALLGAQTQARHLRAPRKPIRIPWTTVAVLIVFAAAGFWVWLGDPWYLMVEDMHVHGVSTFELKKEVILESDMLGWHRFRLRPKRSEEAIAEACPQLREVQIQCRVFPASCDFHADERTPRLIWISGASTYWVDGDGVIFPAYGARADLPVVRGPMPPVEDAEARLPVLQGVAALLELGLPSDDLEYSPQRGLIWTDGAGRRVAFGVGAEMRPRWEVYQSLCSHLDSRGITPSVIDARFPDGVTYAMERSW